LFQPVENKSKIEKRELVDAVLITGANGESCLTITVANFYYAAIKSGLGERIRVALVKKVCVIVGRKSAPIYAIIDLQSRKTTSVAEECGIDGEKKQKDTNAIW